LNPQFRIHLCSSNRDLASERHALLQWLEDMRVRTTGFSFFGSRSLPALETSLQDIASSDAVILLVGHLYGMLAPGHNRSQDEREYDEARRLGKTVLVFMRDEDAARVPGSIERDPSRIPLLKDFRQRLGTEHSVFAFKDAQQLVAKVESEILSLCHDRGMERRTMSRPANRTRMAQAQGESSASTEPAMASPSQAGESSTKTLPLLQKALSTPFSPSLVPRQRKTWVGALFAVILIPLIALGLWKGDWLKRIAAPAPELSQVKSQDSLPTLTDTVQFDSEIALDSTANETDSLLPVKAPATQPLAPDPLTVLFDKAKEGDSSAFFRLGVMYDSGLTLPQDDSLATGYYRKAASKGMVEAQYRLALRHMEGKGAKRSRAQALYWMQAAAGKGYAMAESRLGQMYLRGQGVPKDEVQGLKWLLKAADQNDPDAIRILTEIKSN
jgi:Domain of unknown function (DUF4062)/Sel1 repeat